MKVVVAVLTLGGTVGLCAAQTPASCEAVARGTPPTVVELYTSEGCSSCPPADRWLSTLKGRSDVLALAFHVNYWDQLGWVDRYASPEGTERQRTQAAQISGGSVYTPQVVVNGSDWRIWPRLPSAGATAPAPTVELRRDGDRVSVQVSAPQVPARRLAGYWAVVEDGYESRVRAGENAGATLHHDGVVRLYRPVAPWSAADGLRAQLQVAHGDAQHPRRVVFVVTDAATLKPLQAAALGC